MDSVRVLLAGHRFIWACLLRAYIWIAPLKIKHLLQMSISECCILLIFREQQLIVARDLIFSQLSGFVTLTEHGIAVIRSHRDSVRRLSPPSAPTGRNFRAVV